MNTVDELATLRSKRSRSGKLALLRQIEAKVRGFDGHNPPALAAAHLHYTALLCRRMAEMDDDLELRRAAIDVMEAMTESRPFDRDELIAVSAKVHQVLAGRLGEHHPLADLLAAARRVHLDYVLFAALVAVHELDSETVSAVWNAAG